MKQLEFYALHPDFQRLLDCARDDARMMEKSRQGIVYFSKDECYFRNCHATKRGILSDDIASGLFFETVVKVPPEHRRQYFQCLGLYGENIDPRCSSEIQNMLLVRDEWNLPLYVMNKKGEVRLIMPNDECGRELIYFTSPHSLLVTVPR